MKNQLIHILKNFNKKELRSFQTYLKSWYPRKRQQQQLLSYLIPFHPHFTSKKLTKEIIHKKLFNTPPKGRKLNNLFSDLNLYAKEFLCWQERANHPLEQSFLLIQSLYKRGLYTIAKFELNKVLKNMSQQAQNSTFDYYYLFRFTYFQMMIKHSPNKFLPKDLAQSYRQLNTFYLIHTCKLFSEILNRRNIFKENLLEDEYIIQQVLHPTLVVVVNPLLKAYQQALEMNFYKSNTAFQQLRENYQENYNVFSLEDQYILLQYLINFCVPKIMQGIKEYEQYAWSFHNLGFTQKVFLQNIHRFNAIFLNAVTLGCRLKLFDWVATIINENANYLPKENNTQIKQLAKALLAFEKGNYVQTLELLREIPTGDYTIAIRVKGLTILSLFEIKETVVLFNHLKAFEVFLRTNSHQLSNAVIQRYKRFISVIRLFLKENRNDALILSRLRSSDAIYAKKKLLHKLEM